MGKMTQTAIGSLAFEPCGVGVEYAIDGDFVHMRFDLRKAHRTAKANLSVSAPNINLPLPGRLGCKANVSVYWLDTSVDDEERARMKAVAKTAAEAMASAKRVK